MWLEARREISQADYNRCVKDRAYLEELTGWAAHFSGYPPAGYGFQSPRVLQKKNQYYCAWDRMDNCD